MLHDHKKCEAVLARQALAIGANGAAIFAHDFMRRAAERHMGRGFGHGEGLFADHLTDFFGRSWPAKSQFRHAKRNHLLGFKGEHRRIQPEFKKWIEHEF
jgi:hypothetical protein